MEVISGQLRLSNLYKLTTKCITKIMTCIVDKRDLLSKNQLGTVRYVEGTKGEFY